MKISMNLPDDHQYSIMQRILDGSLTIDAIDEFKEILKIYPEDPLLQRKYADLLLKKSHLNEAVPAYDQAARLFIDNGMNLQAIVAKILQWSIKKPTHDQGRRFHAMIRNEGAQYTPLQRFWAQLSYSELVTIMLRLVRVRLQAGKKVACVDDPADEIYFVVSGTLAETLSPECQVEVSKAGIEVEPMFLGPNDIFGDIFPLDQRTSAETDIVAVTDVELVKISKAVLHDASKKHPHIENLLKEILKPENRGKCDRIWQTVRRTIRFGLPTKVEVAYRAPDSPRDSWQKTGIAVDLSLGGMCVDFGSDPLLEEQPLLKGRQVQLKLDLLSEVATLDLTGKIVWHQKQMTDSGQTVLIGIRFDPLRTSDYEMLTEYCKGSVGEQNLLWSLWDSLIRTDNSDNSDGR